jgi:hypothetical protein
MIAFDSNDVAPKDRVDAWADFTARSLAALKCVPLGAHPFRAKAHGALIGDLFVGRMIGSLALRCRAR